MIGAVGEELGFQAHGLPGPVHRPMLAPARDGQAVGGVELEAGLVRPHLHDNAGPVAGQTCGPAQPLDRKSVV